MSVILESPPCVRRNTTYIGRDLLSTWATKAGAGGPSKGFKARYFVLFPEELCYFTSDTIDGKKKGSIPLKPTEGSVKEVWDVPNYCLCISLPNTKRQYYISFERREIFHLWFLAISSLLHQPTLYMPLNSNLASQPGLIKEGGLMKKGQKNKAWKLRYFVLKAGEASTESKLEYYDEMNGKLKGVIDVTYQISITESKEKEHSFAINLPNGGRNFRLSATATAVKLEWMKALKSVSRTPKFAFSLIEGVLQKRGEMNTGYKDRYCVLLQDKLLYFRTKHDAIPAGMIPITNDTLVVATTEAAPNRRRISLTDRTKLGRVFFLESKDHETIKAWVNQIQIAISKSLLPISPAPPTPTSRTSPLNPVTPKSRFAGISGYDALETKSSIRPVPLSTTTTVPPIDPFSPLSSVPRSSDGRSSNSTIGMSSSSCSSSNDDVFACTTSSLCKTTDTFSFISRTSENRNSNEGPFFQSPSPFNRSSDLRGSNDLDPLFQSTPDPRTSLVLHPLC